jgi:hypothetical protein
MWKFAKAIVAGEKVTNDDGSSVLLLGEKISHCLGANAHGR